MRLCSIMCTCSRSFQSDGWMDGSMDGRREGRTAHRTQGTDYTNEPERIDIRVHACAR